MKQMSVDTYKFFPIFGRFLISIIFLVSGFGKVLSPNETMGYMSLMGVPFPMFGYVGALVIEFIGGILLVVGYQVRIVSIFLSIYSVATALIFHSDFSDQNQLFHFLKNLAMAGGLIQIVAFGAGAYSLDRIREMSKVGTASR